MKISTPLITGVTVYVPPEGFETENRRNASPGRCVHSVTETEALTGAGGGGGAATVTFGFGFGAGAGACVAFGFGVVVDAGAAAAFRFGAVAVAVDPLGVAGAVRPGEVFVAGVGGAGVGGAGTSLAVGAAGVVGDTVGVGVGAATEGVAVPVVAPVRLSAAARAVDAAATVLGDSRGVSAVISATPHRAAPIAIAAVHRAVVAVTGTAA